MSENNFILEEKTPKEMVCGFGACAAIYSPRELTPEKMKCPPWGGCPAVFDVEEITPESASCWPLPACPGVYKVKNSSCPPIGSCPEIGEHGDLEGSYLIIGDLMKPEEFGLKKKVGKGEVLIKVPKKLIDDMEK